ncbi:MAG: hypothetical protein ABL857_02135 [Rickettsiales bacterium]
MLKRFRVLINGKNFKIIENGAVKPASFVTTRYVYALDTANAKEKAIAIVLKEPITIACCNTKDDILVLNILEVNEVCFITAILHQPKGYTFYAVDESLPSNS